MRSNTAQPAASGEPQPGGTAPTLGRYLLVGAIATLVHYGVLATAVELQWLPASLAAATGALAGAAIAYLGNHHYTFPGDRAHRVAAPRFALVALAGAIANGGLVGLGVDVLGQHYLPSQAAATLLVLLAGYSLNRRWTFA